jgi:hypothetical protein
MDQPYTSEASNFESISVDASVKRLGVDEVDGAFKAYITVETADIRYRVDGANQSSTIGHLIPSGGSVSLNSPADICNFRCIAVLATATLMVTYSGVTVAR